MNKLYKKLYKSLVPKAIRSNIDIFRQDAFLKNIRIEILDHYKDSAIILENDQITKVISYLKKNPLHMFPYDFIHRYDSNLVKVHDDEKSEYKYVISQNKRLYYPLGWSEKHQALPFLFLPRAGL